MQKPMPKGKHSRLQLKNAFANQRLLHYRIDEVSDVQLRILSGCRYSDGCSSPCQSERKRPTERLCLRIFEHLGHQLDKDAAKQSPALNQDLASLQQVVTDWFNRYLR